MDGDTMLLQEAIAEISRRARGEDDLDWVVEKVSSLSPPMQHRPLNCWAERCNLQQEALGSEIAASGLNRMVPELPNCWSGMAVSMITPLSPLQLMPYEGGAIGSCLVEIVKSVWSSKKQSQDSSTGLEAEQALRHLSLCRTPSSELELTELEPPSSSAVFFHAPDSSVDEDDSFTEDGSSTVWEWEFPKYDNRESQACFPCWNASASDLDEFLTTLSKQSSDGSSETADELICGGSSFATSPVNSAFVFIPSPRYNSHSSAADKVLRSVLKTSSCYCPRPEKTRPNKRVRFWDQQEYAASSCTSEDSTEDECFSLNYVSPIWAEVSSNTSSSSRSSNEWRAGVSEDHSIE